MKLIKQDIKITKEHGVFFERNGSLRMATLHPAALLRNPSQKPAAFEDFLKLREKIREICEHTYSLKRAGEKAKGPSSHRGRGGALFFASDLFLHSGRPEQAVAHQADGVLPGKHAHIVSQAAIEHPAPAPPFGVGDRHIHRAVGRMGTSGRMEARGGQDVDRGSTCR